MNDKPKFRLMKNGYDRFAVDATVDAYTTKIAELEKKIQAYEQEVDLLEGRVKSLRIKYQRKQQELLVKENTSVEVTRTALREANFIVDSAKQDAETIVNQAITTARLILTDVAQISKATDMAKRKILLQLDNLKDSVDDLNFIDMPDLKWLKEAEEKRKS